MSQTSGQSLESHRDELSRSLLVKTVVSYKDSG